MSIREHFLKMESPPKLTKELYKQIRRKGVTTGSFVFGGYHPESDIDFCLAPYFKPSIHDLVTNGWACYNEDYNKHGSFCSLYTYSPGGVLVNLLYFSVETDFDAWKKATEIMIKILNASHELKEKCKNKTNRVLLFETLKDLCL